MDDGRIQLTPMDTSKLPRFPIKDVDRRRIMFGKPASMTDTDFVNAGGLVLVENDKYGENGLPEEIVVLVTHFKACQNKKGLYYRYYGEGIHVEDIYCRDELLDLWGYNRQVVITPPTQ